MSTPSKATPPDSELTLAPIQTVLPHSLKATNGITACD